MTLDIANKITEQLALSDEKIAQLEGKLADLECKFESVELHERKFDDQEQYSHRNCLRMYNVAVQSVKSDEREDSLKIFEDV